MKATRSTLALCLLLAAAAPAALGRQLSQASQGSSTNPASWIQSGTPQECTGSFFAGNQWAGDEIECHVCNNDYQLKCDLDTDIIGDDSVKCEFGRAGLAGAIDNAQEFACNVDKSKSPRNQCDWANLQRILPGCAWEPVRRIMATWNPVE